MNLDGIHHVTCITGDARANLDFYTGTLGFEVVRDMPFGQGDRWLEVGPPGAGTTIALVRAQSNDQPVEISFLTGDVQADHAGLRSAGVDGDAEVLNFGGGVPPMFTFRDPDGNRFRVVQG